MSARSSTTPGRKPACSKCLRAAAYADDGMTLDQLMAFSVCEDHERQEQVWDMLAHSFNRSPASIGSPTL